MIALLHYSHVIIFSHPSDGPVSSQYKRDFSRTSSGPLSVISLTTVTPTQKSLSHCTVFTSHCASNKVKIHFLVPVTAFTNNQCPITGIN